MSRRASQGPLVDPPESFTVVSIKTQVGAISGAATTSDYTNGASGTIDERIRMQIMSLRGSRELSPGRPCEKQRSGRSKRMAARPIAPVPTGAQRTADTKYDALALYFVGDDNREA